MTKSTQNINITPATRATQKLERVHMDFWGPYKTLTIGGSKYMLTIIDDFSRKSWIYLTKDRLEVYQVFESWRNQVQLESGQKLKAIRSDNTPEFIKLSKELERDGIRVELTVPYTPSQNGVAERLNRTLITKARAMLVTAEMPSQL
jgi:transposase InsO family protein